MTLFGLCKTMAELTAEKFIVPVLEFQRNLFLHSVIQLATWQTGLLVREVL